MKWLRIRIAANAITSPVNIYNGITTGSVAITMVGIACALVLVMDISVAIVGNDGRMIRIANFITRWRIRVRQLIADVKKDRERVERRL